MKFRSILSVVLAVGGVMVGVATAANYPEQSILFDKPVRGVEFSHKVHVQKGMACSICHPRLFAMKAKTAQQNSDFVMDSLYRGKYCGTCHNGSIAFASSTRCGSMRMAATTRTHCPHSATCPATVRTTAP